MKALLLLVIPLFSFAQEIPKGANTIKISGVSFNDAASALVNNGYFVDKKDSALGTIVSSPKPYDDNGKIIIQVRVKDSIATVTGLFNYDLIFNDFFGATLDYREFKTVENIGMKKSAFRVSFAKMKKFAESFNKPIEYSKQ